VGCRVLLLLALGGRETEVPRDEGPVMVDSSKAMSEDDKMLLNCREHVSCAKVRYLIDPFVKLTVASLLRL
jgi:hypothetical protein